jgi:hypothetical protein
MALEIVTPDRHFHLWTVLSGGLIEGEGSAVRA